MTTINIAYLFILLPLNDMTETPNSIIAFVANQLKTLSSSLRHNQYQLKWFDRVEMEIDFKLYVATRILLTMNWHIFFMIAIIGCLIEHLLNFCYQIWVVKFRTNFQMSRLSMILLEWKLLISRRQTLIANASSCDFSGIIRIFEKEGKN